MKAVLMRVSLTLAVLMGVFVSTMSTASAAPDGASLASPGNAPEDQVAVTECVPNYFYLGQTCATEVVGYPAAVPFTYSYAAYPTYYGASYPYAAYNYGYRPFNGYHTNGGHNYGHHGRR
jgi:hypothetical protein